jgi:hypothetical protein
MTSLPDALRPWREWLSWFDPDLAVQLGPLLQRLHPLLGPFRGQRQGGEPELEGLDDLRLRGSYEHLLASEWLLAEEIPDEFLRRAASGEHLFLAPRPRARRADRSIIAVFDTGPLQFGGPRLAHLAIWILLARRAQQAQGEFRWGSLQSPGDLLEARTTDNLKKLLQRRTFALSDAASLASWRTALDQQRVSGERWVIGPSFIQSDLQAGPSFTHRVCLQRDLQGTALDVSLFERGTERRVHLPLPEPSSAAPLLRGVFSREASPEQHTSDARAVALKRPPVISFDGTRVAVALRDESAALVFIVPRSSADQPASPRYQQWSPGYSALAMSFIGKRMGVLLSDEHELRFWGTSLKMTPCPPQEEFHAPGSTAAWLPLAWLRAEKNPCVCVIDQSRRLLDWDSAFDGERENASGKLQLTTNEALGMVQINRGLLIYAYHQNGSVWISRLGATDAVRPPRLACKAPADAEVLFGRGRSCAVRLEKQPKETWRIGTWNDMNFTLQAQLPADSRAVGVMREPIHGGRTSLITLDRNILRLHFTDGGNELLYAAPDRIVSCTVCPNTSIVAMLTERRQFIVVSAATRELRLSVQTAQESYASA